MSETVRRAGDAVSGPEAGAVAAAAEEIAALDRVTRRLRRDCPWDREQDERSIVPHTVEEAYELADAAMSGDDSAVLDELGDVLFQVHFLSLLLEERGAGSLAEVARHCREKLIRRHPHVYPPEASGISPKGPRTDPGTPHDDSGGPANVGDQAPAMSADDVLANWDRIKTDVEGRGSDGPFSDLPENLPALLHARKAQRRAASRIEGDTGLAEGPAEAAERAARAADASSRAVEASLRTGELVVAGTDGSTDTDPAGREAVTAAVGKALFALVDLARQVKVDPELALRAETARYMADCDPQPPSSQSSGEPVKPDPGREGAS